ncbi:MAG: DUF350 domain-containing protein [Pyrinomonadaceae bacterium]|nr:DUF350 domain-containing protein [Pyrinomonadaceae bacterium]
MLMKLFDVPALLLVVKFDQLIEVLVTTLIFVVIGLVVFAIAFLIMNLVTPFSIRKEIEEDHNTALAIVIGAMIIGIAMIVSAAISG